MATYKAAGYDQSSPVGDLGTGGDITVPFSFATSGLATPHILVAGDLIKLVKIPKGAVITDWQIHFPDIDGGANLLLDLGLVTTGADCFLADSTIGQAGGTASPTNNPNGIVTNAIPTAVAGSTTSTPNTVDTNRFDVLQLRTVASQGSDGAGAGGTIKGYVTYNLRVQMYDTFTTLYVA